MRKHELEQSDKVCFKGFDTATNSFVQLSPADRQLKQLEYDLQLKSLKQKAQDNGARLEAELKQKRNGIFGQIGGADLLRELKQRRQDSD